MFCCEEIQKAWAVESICFCSQETEIQKPPKLCVAGNIILGYRNIDEGHLLENVVYLELLRRGYKVNIGKTQDYEVDFVAENIETVKYFQVSRSIVDDTVRERELRSLESISDNYEKSILTMDRTINNDFNGIKIINIIDFLLED